MAAMRIHGGVLPIGALIVSGLIASSVFAQGDDPGEGEAEMKEAIMCVDFDEAAGDRAHQAGTESHELCGTTVNVYSREKTLADCFKYRSTIGMDVVLKALTTYLQAGRSRASRRTEPAACPGDARRLLWPTSTRAVGTPAVAFRAGR